jgi:hypothetical protein
MTVTFLLRAGVVPVVISLLAENDKEDIDIRKFVCKIEGFIQFLE